MGIESELGWVCWDGRDVFAELCSVSEFGRLGLVSGFGWVSGSGWVSWVELGELSDLSLVS